MKKEKKEGTMTRRTDKHILGMLRRFSGGMVSLIDDWAELVNMVVKDGKYPGRRFMSALKKVEHVSQECQKCVNVIVSSKGEE